MITNNDRSGWFGASDTATIMGNWDTATFENWWAEKLGQTVPRVTTWAMRVGNIMEIPIIHAIESAEHRKIKQGKHPVYKPRLRLRANYDGITKTSVVEIKTTGKGFEKIPKNYWEQCQVLMFATRRTAAELYAYHLQEEDYYYPYYPEIQTVRLTKFTISYDEKWVRYAYLPRLEYLAKCLKRKQFPVLTEVDYGSV